MIPFLPLLRQSGSGDPGTGTGLTATYFTDLGNDDPIALDGTVFATRQEGPIDWLYLGVGPGTPYGESLPGSTDWAAKFTGRLYAPSAGLYTFAITADDSACLRLDGSTIASDWGISNGTITGIVSLTAGFHDLYLAYAQRPLAAAYLRLMWKLPGDGPFSVIPAANLYTS
jgi:hypothetical protein